MADILYPEFTVPHIDYSQVNLTAAGGANPILEINADDFSVSREVVVERYIITGYDLATAAAPAAPFTNWIPRVDMRWWIRSHEEASGPRRPVPVFDNAAYERTSYLGSAAGQLTFKVGWRLSAPVVLRDQKSIYGWWSNPAIAVAGGLAGGTVYLTCHGKLARSGKHRSVHVPITFTASAGGGAVGPGNFFGPGPLDQGRNRYGEDLLIDFVQVHTDTTAYPVWDTRIFNHLRIAFWGDTGSEWRIGSQDFTYPLFMFGSHRNIDGLVSIFEPEDGPKLFPSDEGTGFEFQNLSAQAVRMQVARIGRVRP